MNDSVLFICSFVSCLCIHTDEDFFSVLRVRCIMLSTHVHTRTYARWHTQARTHTLSHTPFRTCAKHARALTYTDIHVHTHTHTHTRARTHTHANSLTHTQFSDGFYRTAQGLVYRCFFFKSSNQCHDSVMHVT